MSNEQRLRELAEKPVNWRGWLLLLAVIAQLAVLAGVYAGARYPAWVGEAVQLEVVPVDPRDLFRGNYARLNYTITRLPVEMADEPHRLRRGARVYVSLVEGEGGLWQAQRIHHQHPREGTVLRGRVSWATTEIAWINYGIEAWFAPKEKALALERELRSGAVATIKVAPGGRAALIAIDAGEGLPPLAPPGEADSAELPAAAEEETASSPLRPPPIAP